MTRPNIIRADTIDLQNQDAPSAKDHTRQPARPGPLGEGPPAPHQADALRHVELEISEQHGRSPRASQDLSGKELQMLHEDADSFGAHDRDANENLLRNAGHNGGAGLEDDTEGTDGDESLDDDMMDKISSSPSIGDDGGYSLQLPWPNRGASLLSTSPAEKSSPSLEDPSDRFSSSPFSETPIHYPLSLPRNEEEQTLSEDHHQQGGYTKDRKANLTVDDDYESERRDQLSPLISERKTGYFQEEFSDMQNSYEADFDPNDFHHLLLPADDPLLDNSFDDAPLEESSSESSSPASKSSWNDQATGEADDDTEDISFVDDSRFTDSGWGGECLRETEDIDFDFVYALHTFVATVEGQANATKGDTMVLLDDSNSYWWLVRVAKDSSIGYLPAEHIETPLERLARLNKHRNLDLSQTMLGDQEEDRKAANPLNPLKKAMRRRNVKTVQFAAPTYVEPSDGEYSSDEDEEDHGEYGNQVEDGSDAQKNEPGKKIDDSATVEPHKTRDNTNKAGATADEESSNGGFENGSAAESTRTSDEIFDDDSSSAKSRKGTVRNTDSFFKDDGVETRKINLTPSLLRDDSNSSTTKSSETKELQSRVSLDSLEKDVPADKPKDDRKKKEKRGMLGGMFKRKEKRSKSQEKETEDNEKTSSDLSRLSPQSKESMESLSQDAQASKIHSQPHRQISKLQKTPPAKSSPKTSNSQKEPVVQKPAPTNQPNVIIPEPSRAPPIASDPSESMRVVQPESQLAFDDVDAPAPLQFKTPERVREEPLQSESPKDKSRGVFSPIKDVLTSSSSEPKPEKARKAKNRMHMDDFDSSSSSGDEGTEPPIKRALHEEPASEPSEYETFDAPAALQNQQGPIEQEVTNERDFESPIQVSPRDPQSSQDVQSALHQPPPLVIDTSSQEDRSTSPVSPLDSSPELIEAPHPEETREAEVTPASTAEHTSTSATPTWSDASLRAYLEDDSDIQDLLVVVHEKTGVKARKDHPVVKNLYKEENRKLGEISTRLDGLLGDYLARKAEKTAAVM